ncbi:TetR/AcrR family transcriptional regulator [Embleya scabrispora]|uniref:TetR/AcrR family transcriptional regulator n=1 Tax=Embleya scabrispora TaxID=159449 RepID=UPI0003794612|nr:TetR/AcrR family transcriptional regulator [Embleya scabrispora]MYS83623.1 TetR family transcriptional regulator [Streptomyces sp. SID5474]
MQTKPGAERAPAEAGHAQAAAATPPRRRHAQSNRARILAVARTELIRDADASMDDIARAAGVVRRTVYGHFPSREALVAGLAEEARRDILGAVEGAMRDEDSPEEAVARFDLAAWRGGDRYRLLISFAQRNLDDGGIPAMLAPVRERSIELIAAGQRTGVFADHLPAPVLALALEGMCVALLQAVNEDVKVTAVDQAVASLVALGVPADRAVEVVTRVAAADEAEAADTV